MLALLRPLLKTKVPKKNSWPINNPLRWTTLQKKNVLILDEKKNKKVTNLKCLPFGSL